MQEVLYFSTKDKYRKQLAEFAKFQDNALSKGLFVVVGSEEESYEVINFFTGHNAFLIDGLDAALMPDVLGSRLREGVSSSTLVFANADIFLEEGHGCYRAERIMYLKSAIDRSREGCYRMVLIAKNEEVFMVVPDLMSRIKSFVYVRFGGA